ncbi:hypothetical protein Van01_39350 [Micromonospora andamanensis]|uniref:Transposase zinc-ribbon domain-containing protein n=1 Tax=Micromonospora andamanensis TaxID=1287068 RepID=A0ABQ4HYP0_9ACTN|nr:hypothetical protein Van01_39350 [Micromonospora andamanensis]
MPPGYGLVVTRYRQSRGGIAEVPEVCPARHRDPDGNPTTTPARGQCQVCHEMSRQWRCQEPGCRWVVQHDHPWQWPAATGQPQ